MDIWNHGSCKRCDDTALDLWNRRMPVVEPRLQRKVENDRKKEQKDQMKNQKNK